MTRLSDETLAALPASVARPGYDRAAIRTGVVHLGIGAFHRAHQAAIFDSALDAGDDRWGIVAASLRSPTVRDAMQPQDGLYTLVERGGADRRLRVIGAVRSVIVAPQDPAALVAALAHREVAIVTLTVTEKGYRLDPVTGSLREDDPDVAHDLTDLSAPRTAPGFVVAGLAARRAQGLAPFTAISCDNLPHNGARLRAAVLAIAERHDPALAAWIADRGAFPQTMVDRIVPATTAADIAALADTIGVEDAAMIKTEPFLQWVIEDRFCGPRPDFAALGVQLTDSVEPWETAKLRMLNGAHSGIAYLGALAGIDFVHQFVDRAPGRAFVEALWDETQATLTPPPGLDLASYRGALMTRFANPALQHHTRQIATDGSQKLPQRLIAPIAERLAAGADCDRMALAVAAWMRWQSGVTDAGDRFAVDDPLADRTAAALAGTPDAAARVDALLAIEAIFPSALAADPAFRAMLARHLDRIERHGAIVAMSPHP